MKQSKRISPVAAAAIACAALMAVLFGFYALFYKYHFLWQEQNQIFLYSPDWIAAYFQRPAWLGCLAGEWLTQFYYYLYAGSAILAFVIALAIFLIFIYLNSYKHLKAAIAISLIVGLWLIFSSFSSGCRIDSLVCVIGATAIALVSKPLKAWAIALIPLCFWLFGFGAVVLTALLLYQFIVARPKLWIALSIAAIALCAAAPAVLKPSNISYVAAFSYPSFPVPKLPEMEVEHTLAVENEYYFGNYEKAAKLALSTSYPNAVTAFYYNLAHAKRDSLPDYFLKYPITDLGTLNAITDSSPLSIINMMNDLYYELGDMTYAERAAMMRCVFSPQNRNARMLKRLAQVNLTSCDTLAALKYIGLLSKTLAYRDWAAKNTPGQMPTNVEAFWEAKRAMVNTQDTMRIGDNARVILLELLKSNPANTLALDYLLCTDLWLKDMDLFKQDYDQFCMQPGRPRIKDAYQQALMIYLAGTNAPKAEWERYVQSPSLLQDFYEYSRRRKDPAFKGTYWYYFDTAPIPQP